MLARCLSASLQDLEARPVAVEVDLAPGLPGVQLVGLPDKAIQESREGSDPPCATAASAAPWCEW